MDPVGESVEKEAAELEQGSMAADAACADRSGSRKAAASPEEKAIEGEGRIV